MAALRPAVPDRAQRKLTRFVDPVTHYDWTVVRDADSAAIANLPVSASQLIVEYADAAAVGLADNLALHFGSASAARFTLPVERSSFNDIFYAQQLTVPLIRHLRGQSRPALYLQVLIPAAIDLPRVLRLLGIPCFLHLDQGPEVVLAHTSSSARSWILAGLSACRGLTAASEKIYRDWHSVLPHAPPLLHEVFGGAPDCVAEIDIPSPSRYLQYELAHRHHPLLAVMAEPDTRHFEGCSKVLDLGCGVGIFTWLLSRQGIRAVGVERDPWLVQYAQELALTVHGCDALDYLRDTDHQYDGVYCSHFIEHLPVDVAQTLLAGIARVLTPGGVAVLVFPDPESIRSQLLGFWRDPEHVRFYHPELVATMAASVGLLCEWTSYEDQPHPVVSFPEQPDPMPELMVTATETGRSWSDRLRRWLGLADARQIEALKAENSALRSQIQALDQRTQKLWQVNRTWAWQDNAVLRLRKPG